MKGAMRKPRTGFTLVELMVVIGIIALLVAILLPVLTAARRQANLVKCASNLRQIAHGCVLHAQFHGGYMPLSGLITISTWNQPLPQLLNDTSRKRYSYAIQPGIFANSVLAPLPAAIAPYLSAKKLSFDNTNQELDLQLNDPNGIWKMFICPDAPVRDKPSDSNNANDPSFAFQGTFYVISSGATNYPWSTNADYGLNEGVFGFDFHPQYAARRLAGNLPRLAHPSEVMLLCDSKIGNVAPMANFNHGWITFAPTVDGSGPVTLGDSVVGNSTKAIGGHAQLDTPRHRAKVNVVMADGHVETIPIGPGAFDRVYLSVK
jgi:prepilin-type N-terminal cleavage/methylation domain-containing protein/prepilin-type processing-associated H-X9-DG protein